MATPVGMPLDISSILESLIVQFSVDTPWLSNSTQKMRDIFYPSSYKMQFLTGVLELDSTVSTILKSVKIEHKLNVRVKSLISAIVKIIYNYYAGKDEIRDILAGQVILGSTLQSQENLRDICYCVENISTEILSRYDFVPMTLPVEVRVGNYRNTYCKDYNEKSKENNYASLHSLYQHKEHPWFPVELQFQAFPDFLCATYGSANHEGHKQKYKVVFDALGFDKLTEDLSLAKVNPSGIIEPTIFMALNCN